MDPDSLVKWIGLAVSILVGLFGAWKWLSLQFESVRKEFRDDILLKVNERNGRLDNMRAEMLAQMAKIDRDTSKANNEVATLRLEMVRDYSTRRDTEAALEKVASSLQQQVYRVETMVDRLLGQVGKGLQR